MSSNLRDEAPDEKRRNAITKWWERQTLLDFIARKKASISTHSEDAV